MTATLPLSDISVPVPGYGAMGSSAFYGSFDDEKSKKTLRHAIDIGCTFWDSANIYGCGHNEELIGSVLKEPGLREKVFVATKFGGYQFDPKTRQFTGGARGDPQYVKDMLKDSIERLGFTPDLFYQHRVDPNTPIEDTVKAMDELRKEGKFKYLGLSEASAATIRRAAKVAKIDVLQTEYSPWTTDIERNDIAATCKELGIAIVAYSPLGRGFLTGKYQSADDFEEGDFRKNNPRFSKENWANNYKIVDDIKAIADKKGVTPGQLTLAFIISKGYIPIPGTRDEGRLDENYGAKDVKLSKEEIAELQAVIDKADVAGDRYPPQMMASVNA